MSDELNGAWTELLIQFILLLAGVILPVLAYHGRAYLKQLGLEIEQRVGAERLDAFLGLAELFIRAAEQTFGLDEPEKKERFVVAKLLILAQQYNLPFSHDEIALLVRGLFNSIKRDMRGETAVAKLEFDDGGLNDLLASLKTLEV